MRTGVTEALRQFVALIRDPDRGRAPGREVYLALGRGELREGRTLDALQSAYRVGARVAWREFAAAASRQASTRATLELLAESIFAYIDQLSADSVEGYAEARSRLEGERERRRRELIALLLRDPPADEADAARGRRGARGWALPRSAAALACAGGRSRPDRAAAPARFPDHPTATGSAAPSSPTPAARAPPSGSSAPARRPPPRSAATGPPSALARVVGAGSRTWASRQTAERGAPGCRGPRTSSWAAAPRARAARGPDRRAPAGAARGAHPRARERMEETALAFVQQQGNAAAMARALHLHPQTARYRRARLRELLGEQLDDPDARFELELALRARRGRRRVGRAGRRTPHAPPRHRPG